MFELIYDSNFFKRELFYGTTIKKKAEGVQ